MGLMHNSDLGDFKPTPRDMREVGALKQQGYAEGELLIDTFRGASNWFCTEGQVQSGQAVPRALAKLRRDEGHRGQRAFMFPSEWLALTDEQRAAYKPTVRPKDKSRLSATDRLAEELAGLKDKQRILELEAKLAALTKGKAA